MKKRMMALSLILCLLLAMAPVSASAGNGVTEFPQRCTAYMQIKFRCGCKTTGSGGMIAANGLITAGHNLLCRKHNELVTSITFYFGYVSSNNYFYKYNGKYTPIVYCDFSGGYTPENDIGLIKFEQKVGNKTGWYGSQVDYASAYDGVSGYICYYNDKGKVLICKGNMVEYDDTNIVLEHAGLPSNADGGPLYFLRGSGLNEAVIGVYSSGESGECHCSLIGQNLWNKIKAELSFK